MKKTKLTFCVFLSLMFVLSLFSCKLKGGNSSGDGTTDSGVKTDSDWIFNHETVIIYDSPDEESENLLDSLNYRIGTMPRYGDYSTSKAEGVSEIILGDSGRDLSDKAYSQLDRYFDVTGSGQTLCAWLIYYEDESVAIAYSNNTARREAIRYFVNNYVDVDAGTQREGILMKDSFDLIEYAGNYLEERRTNELDALVDKIGEETVASLKKIFSLYTQDLYIWMVNLYDPVTGGYYYSNSARNTEGFYPDLESTAQAINFLTSSGMLDDTNSIPSQISEQICAFAKSLQSPADGYFYHPQWGTNITASRKGRDLGWAVSLITDIGKSIPLYDTPSGVKGSGGAPGAAAALTTKLETGKVVAVSKVVSAASSLPDYLKSIEKWDKYLNDLNITTRSYWAGNQLAAQHDQIKAAGNEYINYLINFLNDKQNKDTGLWAETVSADLYHDVNGLMKISLVYTYYSATIPNAELALESCFKVMLMEEGDEHVCSVYNPWITIDQLLTSIRRSDGDRKESELRARILKMAPSLIDATNKKISGYMLDDGSFGFVAKYGRAQNLSQDARVSPAKEAEGDVNATCISATGIIANIFDVLGCNEVKLYSPVDYEVYRVLWQDLGEIIKDDNTIPVEKITFDGYDYDSTNEDYGSVIKAHDYATVKIGDTELIDGVYKWFKSSIVKNPADDAKQTDLVLRAQTFLRTGETKDKADSASSLRFDVMGGNAASNCYIFDGDIYFESGFGAECIGHFMFGSNFVSLNVYQYTSGGKQYVQIGENFEGLDGLKDKNVAIGIPMNEWVKIRIEVYRDLVTVDEASEVDIKVKVFVNGEYTGECDAGYVSAETGKFTENITQTVSYSFYRHAESVTYFNNVTCQKTTKKFVSEKPISMIYPDVLFFENDSLNSHSNKVRVSNDSDYLKSEGSYIEIQTVKDENDEDTRAMVFSSNAGGVDNWRVYRASSAKDKNLFTYVSKMKMDFDEGSSGEISFFLGSVAATSYNAYRFKMGYDAEGDSLTLSDASASSGLIGETVTLGVKNGEWFDLKVDYYEVSDYHILVLIYVNDKQVYASDNYYNPDNDLSDLTWPVGIEYVMPNGSVAPAGVSKILLTTDKNCDVDITMDALSLNWYGVVVPEIAEDDYNSRHHKDDGPPAPPETEEGNGEGVVTFFDGDMTAEGGVSLEVPSGYVSSNNAKYGASIVKNPNGNDTYAFVIDSNTGAQDKWRIVKAADAASGMNLVSFSSDILLDFAEDASGNIDIFLGSTVTQNYNAYRLSIGYDSQSGTLTLNDASSNNEYSGSVKTLTAENGKWFNLKIEYYKVNENEILVLVYINGVVAYVSNNYYNGINNNDDLAWSVGSSYTTPGGTVASTGISKVQLVTDADTDVTVMMDNVAFGWSSATLPATDSLSYDSERSSSENLPPLTPGEDSSTTEDMEQNTPDGTWQ